MTKLYVALFAVVCIPDGLEFRHELHFYTALDRHLQFERKSHCANVYSFTVASLKQELM